MPAEGIFLEHEIEGCVKPLGWHPPCHQRAGGQFICQQRLPHPAHHPRFQHCANALQHRGKRHLALLRDGMKRMAHKATDAILADGENARIDRIGVFDWQRGSGHWGKGGWDKLMRADL